MAKKSKKQKQKKEIENYCISNGIQLFILGIIFLFISVFVEDFLFIYVALGVIFYGILMFSIRVKLTILISGIIDLLVAVFVVVIIALTFSYPGFWSGILLIGTFIFFIWSGVLDIQKYYKLSS